MPPQPVSPKPMPFQRYQRFVPLAHGLADRTWPDKRIEKAPLWCSVDLRDGNQALIDPMDLERKRRMFDAVVKMGFKEIEVGFPSASQPDFDFVRGADRGGPDPRRRHDPGADAVPPGPDRADLRVPARAPRGPSSTSTTRRRSCSAGWCSGWTGPGIIDIAVNAAKLCRKLEQSMGDTAIRYEYSPESFTGTEPDYARGDLRGGHGRHRARRPDRPIILNLPATVEMLHAERVRRRDRVVPPPRSATVSRSCCPCTPTTTGAAASPPPSSA